MTWRNYPEILVKKWKCRAFKALEEQLGDGCFNYDHFDELVSFLTSAKSKKEYVENYWNYVEENKLKACT